MKIKNDAEIKIMKEGGLILAKILKNLKNYIKPGMITMDIEKRANGLLQKYHVKSAFKGFNSYPFSTCISINEEIVHGLPSGKLIKEGDIVGIDFGVRHKGYNTDSAFTIGIGKINQKNQKLIDITKKSLDNAIQKIKPGVHLGDIQAVIQKTIVDNKLVLVKNLTGHGIGKNLQEEPIIENFGQAGEGIILAPGMVFCLEPMATFGNGKISVSPDGWTIVTSDATLSAHFEHTIVVTKKNCEVLTKF